MPSRGEIWHESTQRMGQLLYNPPDNGLPQTLFSKTLLFGKLLDIMQLMPIEKQFRKSLEMGQQ